MEYNSFYGGRRGASFVIVKRFSTIKEMVAAFQQGGGYKTVNYDEYVLIDTINKNDKDNGKIYRRGYDYNNSMGGAIFEGQIVGPSGPAPHTVMTTIDEVDKITKEDGLVDDDGNTYRRTEGKYAPTVNLVPGAKGTVTNRTFDDTTDSIQWAAVSVRDANSYESTVYVGFKFPYPVIDYTAQSVSPYYNRSNNTSSFINQDLADRTDDGQHPFFEKWNISIPKGIKGDTFKNFRVIPAESAIQDYTGKDDDIANNREVLVYDYYHYDAQEGGEPVSIYLGDYNMIDDITVDEEGTFTINYSHDDNSVWTKIFKWIKSISLNTDNGNFVIEYNHETDADGASTKYETNLDWIKNISFSEDGTITLDHTYNEDTVFNKLIKWVKTVTLDGTTGHLVVEYNHETDAENQPTKYETDLRWVNNITVSDDGQITLKYTTGSDVILNKKLNFILETAIDDRYHLLVLYTDPDSIEGTKVSYNNKDNWVDLGYIGYGDVGAVAGREIDTGVTAVANILPPYSAWLIVEDGNDA